MHAQFCLSVDDKGLRRTTDSRLTREHKPQQFPHVSHKNRHPLQDPAHQPALQRLITILSAAGAIARRHGKWSATGSDPHSRSKPRRHQHVVKEYEKFLLFANVGVAGHHLRFLRADRKLAWGSRGAVCRLGCENAVVGDGHLEPGMQVLVKPSTWMISRVGSELIEV